MRRRERDLGSEGAGQGRRDEARWLGDGPNTDVLDRATRLLRPLLAAFDPCFVGLDRVPTTGGNVFVGNHTMIGMLDYAVLYMELYRRLGVTVWSLADHFHYMVPLWRDLLLANGTFDGTRENCAAVLALGGNIMIFPGGAREVTRRSGEQNTLLWGDRTGFARVATAAGAPIVPIAFIGGDDWYRIVYDTNRILGTRLGDAVDARFRRHGMNIDGYVPSIIRGIGPTLLPRPERLYYWFGEPIVPSEFGDDPDDEVAVRKLRDAARDELSRGMSELLSLRERDPRRNPASFVRHLFRDRRPHP